jgi:hypothetical protein
MGPLTDDVRAAHPALAHVIDSISGGGEVFAATVEGDGLLLELARALRRAQRTTVVRTRPGFALIAGDLPLAAPGIDLGSSHPTTVAVDDVAEGRAAVARIARNAGAVVTCIDAGMTHSSPHALPLLPIAPTIWRWLKPATCSRSARSGSASSRRRGYCSRIAGPR